MALFFFLCFFFKQCAFFLVLLRVIADTMRVDITARPGSCHLFCVCHLQAYSYILSCDHCSILAKFRNISRTVKKKM